tara:strand:+ start:569 stop:730 length:162 start_codon:yes stop_codon:yes gene_type:complete
MYKVGGIEKVYDWYTKGVDAIITETGLASDISDLIGDKDDKDKIDTLITNSKS